MKNTAKKLLAIALVLMLTLPLAVFPASAEDEITPLYTVNFNGDSNMATLGEGWDGFGTNGSVTPSADGKSVSLTIESGKWANASAQLNGLNVQNGAYTFVFTVTASDNNEEVGLLLDHQTGFVVNPGQNTYRYTSHLTKGTLIETAQYNGTGELTQTYAIEVAGEGTGTNSKDQPYVDITTYKLYNLTTDGSDNAVWNLACTLTETQLNSFTFDWGDAGDCDGNFYCRLSRDRKNFGDANDGTITVSNFTVYQGLVADDIVFAEPDDSTPREYDSASNGDLLYTVNFSGDSIFSGANGGWAGATVTKTDTSVTMSTHNDGNNANRASVWGADLQGYTIFGKSYTVVFTLTASDADEEIGFLPCDWAGFVITPGQNAYRFITTKNGDGTDGAYEMKVKSGTYNGTGALTQTYAIEFATSGTDTAPSVDTYNLYVAQGGEWVLVCSLTDIDESIFDWFYYDGGVYEEDFTMRFYRRGYIIDQDGWTTSDKDTTQDGTVTVSDAKIYKGLIATNALVDAPDTPGVENNGNGNSNNQNTDNGNDKNNDKQTSQDTTEATEAATEAESEAATSGCGGTIGIGGAVLLVSSAIGMIGMTCKKKED